MVNREEELAKDLFKLLYVRPTESYARGEMEVGVEACAKKAVRDAKIFYLALEDKLRSP
jgi:hypothetical protein